MKNRESSKKWRVEHIDDVPPLKDTFSKGWKSIRWHMDIQAFGVNAVTKPKGEWLTDVHDEKDGNQDELFLVIEGLAQFELDGKKIKVTKGTLVSVKPLVKRGALAMETPTTLLIIGAPVNAVYKPPAWDQG